jgi:hypothetical protein
MGSAGVGMGGNEPVAIDLGVIADAGADRDCDRRRWHG